MKIKSNFKDYYDSCQGFGTDDIVYMRYTKQKETILPYRSEKLNYLIGSFYFTPFYIGFCGKMYSGLIVEERDNTYSPINVSYVYNLSSVDKIMESADKYSKSQYHATIIPRYSSKSSIKKFFDNNKELKFDESKTLYTVSYYDDKETIEYDTKLSDWEFGKVFDSYTAYQEIHSYLNNKAIPIKPIPQLDDKTMRDIKGFDKYSFKKDPSNRRKV